MRRVRKHWTTHDLELFHDEELGSTERDELREALRRDQALRNRLATVSRVDDALRAALADNGVRQERYPARFRWLSFGRLAAASLFVALIPAALWYTRARSVPPRSDVLGDAADQSESLTDATAYEPIRIVFSLPVGNRMNEAAETRGVRSAKRRPLDAVDDFDDRAFLARLDQAMRSGSVPNTVVLLESASQERRRIAYRYMGGLLHSALVAEQILDGLSPSEQLAVCGEWAQEPRLRPVAFERLRGLSGDPSLSDSLQVLTARLAHDSELRMWLRSYQLVDRSAEQSPAPT